MDPRVREGDGPGTHADPAAHGEISARGGDDWFVYLYALTDCTAFKVGFTCNPLQRICTFSRRYFEQFDLAQSQLVRLDACDDARALEAVLKAELAVFRVESPSWVPLEAGGHTEWFSAVYFAQAEERCRTCAPNAAARLINVAEYVRGELARVASSFESWAWRQAQEVLEMRAAVSRGYSVGDAGRSLRDWLDAYRYFDLPLFADDPDARAFVHESARLRADS